MSIFNHHRHNELKAKYFGKFFDRLPHKAYYVGDFFDNNNFALTIYPGVYKDSYNGIQVSLCGASSLLEPYPLKSKGTKMIDVGSFAFYLDHDRLNITYLAGANFNKILSIPDNQDNKTVTKKAQLHITKALGINTREFLFLLASLMALHLDLSKVYMIDRLSVPGVYTPQDGALYVDDRMAEYFQLHTDREGHYWDAQEIIHYIAQLPQDHREKLFEAMDSLASITNMDTKQSVFRKQLSDGYAGELIGLLRENMKYKK